MNDPMKAPVSQCQPADKSFLNETNHEYVYTIISNPEYVPRRLLKEFFRKFSAQISELVGSYWAFALALLIIILWALTGPLFDFSDTWQLVINTGTTIVTFLMVFLIQNTQNRDAKEMHLKLDELIRSHKEARNALIDLEDLSDEELNRLEAEFTLLRTQDKSLHNSLTAVEKMINRHRPKQKRKH